MSLCKLCARNDHDRVAIASALAAGQSMSIIAARFKTNISALQRHKKHVQSTEQRSAPLEIEFPRLGPDATPLEKACANVQHLEELLNKPGRALTDRMKLQTAYDRALKLQAKLSGALDITPAQILNSQFFKDVMREWAVLLAKYPKLLSKMKHVAKEE